MKRSVVCEPAGGGRGTRHYHFRLYALDKLMTAYPGLDHKAPIAAMSGHVLQTADLVGTYERPKA